VKPDVKPEMGKKDEIVKETSIPGVLVIERPTFKDKRGFFGELARKSDLQKYGIDFEPIQFNHSRSYPGVIRGLHAERWNKLVYPVTGEMVAVLVDIRPDSPSFGQVETIKFNAASRKAVFIPEGVANSICVVGNEPVDYIYAVDAYYDGSDARAIAWDDPDLAIDWPVENPIISERDRDNPTLRELFPEKFR